MDEQEAFLRALIGRLQPGEHAEMRAIRPESHSSRQCWFRKRKKLLETARELKVEHDVYFGVTPRRGRHGDEEHVARINALWADVDAKCFGESKKRAMEALQELPLPPSAVVDSGRGYHAYWFLTTPIQNDAEGNGKRLAQAAMRGIREALTQKADSPLDNVHDLARILRVPGTLNHKEEPPLPVELVALEAESTYDVAEFVNAGLWKESPVACRQPETHASYELDDEEVVERAEAALNGEKFKQLMGGDWSEYKSQSEADLALCSILAFHTGGDREQIDRIFRESRLWRDKWDEQHSSDGTTYGDATIEKAVSSMEAPAVKPVTTRAEKARNLFHTAQELFERVPEKARWIVEPYVAEGSITLLAGLPKEAGKTTFVFHAIKAMLDEAPFLGKPTLGSPVVLLTEERYPTLSSALARAGLAGHPDLHVCLHHETIGVSWAALIQAAGEKCLRVGAKLLVLDTLAKFAGLAGDNENKPGDVLQTYQPLDSVAAKGIAIWISHHERKAGGSVGQASRGSNAVTGAADIIMSLRPQPNSRSSIREIHAISRYDQTPALQVIKLLDDGYISMGNSTSAATLQARDMLLEAPSLAEEAKTRQELMPGVPETTQKNAVVAACVEGWLERVGKGRKGDPYRYYRVADSDREAEAA